MFGAGAGDADGIGLLKAIGADHEGRNLPGQNHHRDRIHQRVGQAGHRIGCPRPGGYQNHTGFAGGARITFGGVGRALFVAHQDVADIVLLKDLVIDRQDGAAGIAEYRIHPLILQGLNHHLCATHPTGHCIFSTFKFLQGVA